MDAPLLDVGVDKGRPPVQTASKCLVDRSLHNASEGSDMNDTKTVVGMDIAKLMSHYRDESTR